MKNLHLPTDHLAGLLWCIFFLNIQVHGCPVNCRCGYNNVTINSLMAQQQNNDSGYKFESSQKIYVTNCSNLNLYDVPEHLPQTTQCLDLSNNQLVAVHTQEVENLTELTKLYLHGNPDLRELPLIGGLDVWVDSGYACCIHEIEVQKAGLPSGSCDAVEPYKECSSRLVKVFTIVIYICVILFFIIVNPWLTFVTLSLPNRRKDPYVLNTVYFCVSNALICIYTIVVMCAGCAYFTGYHYHMEEWVSSALCGFVGYCLISGTLAAAFLYMIQVICIFQKLRYPLQIEKHLKIKHLHIGACGAFVLSFLFAMVPFFVSRTYNEVGLCLPFYAGDYKRGYKYVLLYTIFMGITTVVNCTLLALLFRSFIDLLRNRDTTLPAVVRRDFLNMQRRLILGMVVYLLIQFVTLAFLALSSAGGSRGETGREWFTRIVVLETISWPLMGPLRNPALKSDTKKAFSKLPCYHWLFPHANTFPDDSQESRWSLLKRTISSSFRNTFSTRRTTSSQREASSLQPCSSKKLQSNKSTAAHKPLIETPDISSPASSPIDEVNRPSLKFHMVTTKDNDETAELSPIHSHIYMKSSKMDGHKDSQTASKKLLAGRSIFGGSVKEHNENMLLLRESPVKTLKASEETEKHKESQM